MRQFAAYYARAKRHAFDAVISQLMPNPILEKLPNLTPNQLKSAQKITLELETNPDLMHQWEYSRVLFSSFDATSENQIFAFEGKAGAAYSIVSQSFLDPENLVVYDAAGKPIDQDDGQLAYGLDHAYFFAPYSGTFYVNPSLRQGASSDNKDVSIGVFEDSNYLKNPHVVIGTAKDDLLAGVAGNDTVTGGAGIDTWSLVGTRSSYHVYTSETAVHVSPASLHSGVDTLREVERIRFSDVTLSFETTGVGPQAYRLYQAAFGRTPDAAGLGYWIKQIENGMSLKHVATEFATSAEFVKLYGPGLTNDELLYVLYTNVLHRVPDAGGRDYWMRALESNQVTRTDMLVQFSESSENQAQVIGALKAGFEYV